MEKFLSDAREFFPILMQGVGLTILVTLGSLALSTVLGMVWALMRVSGFRFASMLSAGLINLIRGIPIIVLLFYLYFVMPDFGITLSALQAAILGTRHRLLGLPGGKLPRRDRSDRQGTDRGRTSHRHGMVADHAPGDRAAGRADRAAALRQHHDHDAEGFLAGLHHHGGGACVCKAS